jgi:ADP-dependent phosphofructokinase/glucokinase
MKEKESGKKLKQILKEISGRIQKGYAEIKELNENLQKFDKNYLRREVKKLKSLNS